MMTLRFNEAELRPLSHRYSPSIGESELIKMKPSIGANGYISPKQLFAIARWKSPRSAGTIHNNSAGFIREITSISLTTKDERMRIEVLTVLDGVSWPTASVILHFFHPRRYPILDVRSLWSLTSEPPSQYYYSFWWEFVQFNRTLSSTNRIDMRQLDRALWQYSFEHQKP
jgi:hypothetical protein